MPGGGTLFVVATPLGNLADITPRAVEALRSAALVACEDTRRTRGLLAHLGIRPPRVLSCHKFNEKSRVAAVLAVLREGGHVALVSDGGTPGVSDPGAAVVAAALEEGLAVSPIPGPSAVAAAVSACGFEASTFVFAGFLPARGGERRRAIEALREERRPIVLYEAPHRAAATAADLAAALGDRRVTLLREMTKRHEEVRRTTLAALAASLAGGEPLGEFTLVVEGAPAGRAAARKAQAAAAGPAGPPGPEALRRRYAALIAEGADRREALKRLVRESGLSRREVYAAVRGGSSGAGGG